MRRIASNHSTQRPVRPASGANTKGAAGGHGRRARQAGTAGGHSGLAEGGSSLMSPRPTSVLSCHAMSCHVTHPSSSLSHGRYAFLLVQVPVALLALLGAVPCLPAAATPSPPLPVTSWCTARVPGRGVDANQLKVSLPGTLSLARHRDPPLACVRQRKPVRGRGA